MDTLTFKFVRGLGRIFATEAQEVKVILRLGLLLLAAGLAFKRTLTFAISSQVVITALS